MRFEPRIRFNWGYHDAVFDSERRRPRELVLKGQQNLQRVSRQFDSAYFDGYKKGLEHFAEGRQSASSEPAWKELQEAKKSKRMQELEGFKRPIRV